MTTVTRSSAPIRICDLGGWTDTAFAEHGLVVNIAVEPRAEVGVVLRDPAPGPGRRGHCQVHVLDYRETFELADAPQDHALLVAAIEDSGLADADMEVTVRCGAPPGSSTGTSAAVAVALIGALDGACGRSRSRLDVATAAHRLEVDRLGRQSGVQDQIASALGGVNSIEITRYPEVSVTPLLLQPGLASELERRLLLVYLGGSHDSSRLHEKVIANLGLTRSDHGGATVSGAVVPGAGAGRPRPALASSPRLEALRLSAAAARQALADCDIEAFGRAMVRNTDAQAELSEELVSPLARSIIGTAARQGAAGWKVNGAGGTGGSLTLLCGRSESARARLLAELGSLGSGVSPVPVNIDRDGLLVTTGQPQDDLAN
ncbi:MAG: GHMP family kinase ATP-binding protein [Acidimicrobiales bacterium]